LILSETIFLQSLPTVVQGGKVLPNVTQNGQMGHVAIIYRVFSTPLKQLNPPHPFFSQ
jgi:hypothetical protein